MGIELGEYKVLDAVELEKALDNNEVSDTVDKLQLVSHMVDSYVAGKVAQRGHIITVNTLEKLKVTRDNALQFLALQVPNWPVKNPQDRAIKHEAWGKDSKAVTDLRAIDAQFDLIVKSFIAFNTWCSRRYNAGSWVVKEVGVTKLPDNKEDDTPQKDKKAPVNITVEAPSRDQLAKLTELQVISLFMDVITASDKFEEDQKDMVQELCAALAMHLEPELAAKLAA